MGRITINIDDELEKAVRTEIAMTGGKKGELTKTVEYGLRLWLNFKTKKQGE